MNSSQDAQRDICNDGQEATHSTHGSIPPYLEGGPRLVDRQEAHSLRLALEDIDATQEERRIHESAQDEASRLVMEHQNPAAVPKPVATYRNPDLPRKHYTRTKLTPADNTPGEEAVASKLDQEAAFGQPRKMKSYHGLANAVAKDVALSKRRVSSGRRRKASTEKGLFPNPDDKIFEETDEIKPSVQAVVPKQDSVPSDIPRHVRRNPFARVRMTQEKLLRTKTAPAEVGKPAFNAVDIHKNPPTQSRKAWYHTNKDSSSVEPKDKASELQTAEPADVPQSIDGKERGGVTTYERRQA